MKKFKKIIRAFIELAKNPWLINHILSDNSIWKKKVEKQYRLEKGLPLIEINDMLPNFSETLEVFAFLDGGSLPTDIALLKGLTKKIENCSYFEIGTWRGESVANIADDAKECYTLNLSKTEILELGLSEKYADLHAFFSKEKKNITHLYGNSKTYDFSSLGKKFDLIFIDGDHNYDYVKNDTEKIFKNLIHEKSIIVWHDYAYTPEKIRHEVLLGILDGTPKEMRKHLYHVSNTLCAIFIKQEFNTANLVVPSTPNKNFKIQIESKSL